MKSGRTKNGWALIMGEYQESPYRTRDEAELKKRFPLDVRYIQHLSGGIRHMLPGSPK